VTHSGTDQTPKATEFESLLLPVLDRAYALALGLTHDRTAAEDLVQEASLLAFRAFHTFQRGTNFRAWFFKILTNAFYSAHRRSKREAPTVELDEAAELYLYGRMAEAGLHAASDDPAAVLIGKMDTEQIVKALAALPEEFRVVCTLYFIEDYSYEQIAETLGVPIGTVRSRLHRGRKMLQKRLWQIAVDEGIVKGLAPRAEAGS
jgi:RNA polymerase sigma-70 factor (ECF subfamily)